jgi:membrane protease YdiL (CAAX protease family)
LPLSEVQPRIHRSLQLALFGASITWAVAANLIATRAARGLAVRFQWSDEFLLLDAVFLVFLLAMGFAALEGIVARSSPLRKTLGLPKRPTARVEWATGVAIGWGVVLLAVLPMAMAGDLHVRFWLEARSVWLAGLNLVTVALLALAAVMAFFGYPYRRLIDAIGAGWATVVMSVVFGAAATFNQDSTYLSTLIAILFGAVLCSAWLRTHGLWLGWGVYFAWIASLGILFGLPVGGVDNLSSLVETRAIGARWLTGGELGPEGALVTLLLMIAAIVVVVKVSGDWAWDYTRPPLVPAGYPMDVPPPAEHVEMEKAAAPAGAGLVQILPVTPQTRSVETER